MNPSLIHLARQREHLRAELSRTRRNSIQASTRGDFRGVAKLTLEAARLNREIESIQDKELLAG